MRLPQRRATLSVAILLAVLAGCASMPKLDFVPKDGFAKNRNDRRERALKEFEESRNEAEFQAALALWDKGDIAACESALTRVLERTASHRDARLLLADCLLARNERPQAGQHMERALLDHPNDPSVAYAMAVFLDEVGRQDEAMAHYQRAATGAPGNEVYRMAYTTAREATNKRRSNQGIALATATEAAKGGGAEVSPVAPGLSAPVPTLIGKPKDPHKTNCLPEPAMYIDAAAETEDSEPESAMAWVQRGRIALSEAKNDAAVVCFRRAMAADPDNPNVAVSAAVAALRYDQPQLAIQLIRPVEERFAKSAALKQTLGVACYRAGDHKAAQLAFEQSLSLDKSNALSYFLMGCTLAKIGQHEAADSYLRQANAIDPRYGARR